RQVFLPVALLSWMKSPVYLLESCAIDVGVNLRRGNIRMAQHRLYGAKIGAALEQMGGKRMTQGVRRDPFLDTGCQRITADQFPESLARQRASRAIDKYKSAGFAFEQSRPCAF